MANYVKIPVENGNCTMQIITKSEIDNLNIQGRLTDCYCNPSIYKVSAYNDCEDIAFGVHIFLNKCGISNYYISGVTGYNCMMFTHGAVFIDTDTHRIIATLKTTKTRRILRVVKEVENAFEYC